MDPYIVADPADGSANDATWARTISRTCVWVSSNPAQCFGQTGTDGRRAWLACSEACGACQAALCADATFRARVGRLDCCCTWTRRDRPGRNYLRTGIDGVPAYTACPDACGASRRTRASTSEDCGRLLTSMITPTYIHSYRFF